MLYIYNCQTIVHIKYNLNFNLNFYSQIFALIVKIMFYCKIKTFFVCKIFRL